MRKPRINKGFSAYSDSKLDLKTEVIITSITVNNPNFSPILKKLSKSKGYKKPDLPTLHPSTDSKL